MSNGVSFPSAATLGQGTLAGDPGLGIGNNPLGTGTQDPNYGTFNPYGDINANQGFEIPGGGLGGFTPIGYSGSTGGSAAGSTDSGTGGIGGPPSSVLGSIGGSDGTVGGNAPGQIGVSGGGCTANGPFAGGSWNPLCIMGGSGCNPCGTSGTSGASGSSGTCAWNNWTACFASIGDFATRTAVVFLGFIFVMVGLLMFGLRTPYVRNVVPSHPVLRP